MERKSMAVLVVVASLLCVSLAAPARAADSGIDADAREALNVLLKGQPAAQTLAAKAKAILVFPSIIKAGFLVGGAYGEGVLFQRDRIVGHYNSVAASYGLQAGVQTYGYAMFLMSKKALTYLDSSSGWEIGVGPSVVIVDEGMAKSLTSTTLRDDVYAFIFSQKGLMAGVGIQGSKITKVKR